MSMRCADARESLAELALGVATGEERDRLLAHVSECADCREELAALTRTVGELWQAPRPIEPPPGFDQRVLAAMAPPATVSPLTPRPRRGRLVAAVAAAGLLLGGLAGWAAHRAEHDSFSSEYVDALRQLGGRALAASPLVDSSGRSVGRAFVYEGETSWLFVERGDSPAQPLHVMVDGRVVGTLTGPAWGGTVAGLTADDLHSVTLVDDAGSVIARADRRVVPSP